VQVAGGNIQTIANLKSYSGGCWLDDDTIVLATADGIVRIPASGGTPVQVTQITPARGETYHSGCWPLPDRRHFLYLRGSTDANNAGVYVGRVDASPDAQSVSRLMPTQSLPVYAADERGGTGHLLFLEDSALMAQAFDPRQLELLGEAVQVPGADRVHVTQRFAAISASVSGAIAYRRGGSELGSLVVVGRDGKELRSIAKGLANAQHPRLSPDGRSLALIVSRELWKHDLEGRPAVKLTFDGALSPVWSPDGRRIVYEGGGTLRAVAADGGGKPEDIAPKGHFHPHSLTPDSREIVAVQLLEAGTLGSLVRLPLQPGSAPVPITQGGFSAALSPDGRWLAYTAETTGAQEIWVRPYPGPGAPIRVSPGGGTEPVWARSGRELFYIQEESMMSVAIETSNGFNFKPAVKLFDATFYNRGIQPPSYDVSAEGGFVVIKPDDTRNEPITVILNWTELVTSNRTRH
jgi:serine/threonine-protein kinase